MDQLKLTFSYYHVLMILSQFIGIEKKKVSGDHAEIFAAADDLLDFVPGHKLMFIHLLVVYPISLAAIGVKLSDGTT